METPLQSRYSLSRHRRRLVSKLIRRWPARPAARERNDVIEAGHTEVITSGTDDSRHCETEASAVAARCRQELVFFGLETPQEQPCH